MQGQIGLPLGKMGLPHHSHLAPPPPARPKRSLPSLMAAATEGSKGRKASDSAVASMLTTSADVHNQDYENFSTPTRPSQRQRVGDHDPYMHQLAPVHQKRHSPLRASKSLGGGLAPSRRSDSHDSIHDLAESLIADVEREDTTPSRSQYWSPIAPAPPTASEEPLYHTAESNHYHSMGPVKPVPSTATVDDAYTDHLRNSSYAMLNRGSVASSSAGGGPQSMLPSVIASRFTEGQRSSSNGYQSLPYVSSPMLIDGKSPADSKKTPRTCELEEYARRYEAIQRGTSSRRRVTPPAGSSNSVETAKNFWQQRARQPQPLPPQAEARGVWQTPSSGRESVSTVISNSSSETVKYQDHHMESLSYQQQQGRPERASFSNYQNFPARASDYASLPPEPRTHRDLKKFPLQTYPSQSLSTIADDVNSVSEHNSSTGSGSNKENHEGAAAPVGGVSRRHKMRHQMSERQMSMTPNGSEQLHHSKSVPNLLGGKEEAAPTTPVETSFSYLDPDKRMRVTDNTLRLIQKQALLEYYERRSSQPQAKRSPGGTVKQQQQLSNGRGPEMDSGFYSPIEGRNNNIGAQHQQRQTTMGDVDEILPAPVTDQQECEYDDDDLDEELQKVTEGINDEDEAVEDAAEVAEGGDEDESARPVYLAEHANGFKSGQSSLIKNEAWHFRQKEQEAAEAKEEEEMRNMKQKMKKNSSCSSLGGGSNLSLSPPQRPPKKPHMRGEQPETPPPRVPSRPASRASSSAASSRGATPVCRKPKFPSPPGSPTAAPRRMRTASMTPPPPTPPPASLGSSGKEQLPLPPPPPQACLEEATLRLCDRSPLSPVNAHRMSDSPSCGVDGKYRRTSSPAAPPPAGAALSPPGRKVSLPASQVVGAAMMADKSPAKTPKRESPATIAARGAPGWEKFLGGKTSTVQFTSEELSKLKQQRDVKQRNLMDSIVGAPKPPPKPKSKPAAAAPPTETSFDCPPSPATPNRASAFSNAAIGLSPLQGAKSSPSLNQSLSSPNPVEPIIKKPSARVVAPAWKNSLDSLRAAAAGPSPVRGFTAAQQSSQQPSSPKTRNEVSASSYGGVSHSHSNSDSGLSSLSGRTSTMSPISTMSTVSSVSSTSSSGSSSRASLRSASIVSSCTIPLDEEDEEVEEEEMMMMLAAASPENAGSSPSGTASFQTSRFLRESSRRGVSAASGLAREKLPEEVECDELSKELMDEMEEEDKKLSALFGLPANAKTSADYLEGLFDFGDSSNTSSNRPQSSMSPTLLRNRIEVLQSESKKKLFESGKPSTPSRNATFDEMEMNRRNNISNNDEDEDLDNKSAIRKKKELLLSRLAHKLDLLRAAQLSLKDETRSNEEAGRAVTAKVNATARPNECDKYKLTVEETDKITSLIVGLAGRLAKAENALAAATQAEKEQLTGKRDKLSEQLTEARKLKSNIDKRSESVGTLLRSYLDASEYSDFESFLRTKAKLIVESREVADKVALAEEQIRALKESL